MSTIFLSFFAFIVRAVLSLRYKIEVEGLDQLREKLDSSKKGVLFLPNHPAHMDPLFIFLILWPRYRMRPLVIEYIYRMPLMRPFIAMVKAISVPNFENSINELKIKRAQEALEEISAGLKKGDHFIIYPSGRLKSSGKEVVGGASGAHDLVQECPNTNIVLIRTSGLWGSSFSRAIEGRSPDLVPAIFRGVKVILKNLIFFAPRRKVYIEIETNPTDFPRKGTRLEFNRYLEVFYNRYRDDEGKIHPVEPAKLVSYSFRKKDVLKVFHQKKRSEAAGGVTISKETETKIYAEIRKILENSQLEIRPEMSLTIDLGMDSLNMAELITYVSQNFDVDELHPEDLETVQTLLERAEGTVIHVAQRPAIHFTWPKEAKRPLPLIPGGRTIPEVFLRSVERMGHLAACGDDVVGVLSYKKVKQSVFVLAQYFRTYSETHIGVLLPATAGAYIVVLALQLAGKVPVMLNWTLGPRYLEEMMHLAGAKNVITSWRFLDRLTHVDLGKLANKMHYLEEIRKNLTLGMKLKGAFLAKCPIQMALRSYGQHRIDENSPAVILFTSGSESVPKGVPLSHKNILSNTRAGLQCLDLKSKDVMYGILPPFHSFGFSVAGLFALISGLKIAFYPDPTDSFALAEGIHRWKVTIFCSAPSFLKGLLAAAKPEQLKTVRYFVTGAEKTSAELYKKVERLETGARVIEGYGITECSPVLTISRPNLPPKGVGRLLPDIEFCTIHPETEEVLSPHTEGEICVRGPNIFHGYLGKPRAAFIKIDGKQWYRTGDLGFLDKNDNLILSGRLKRFTKVGGEMISLGAVEEAIVKGLHVQGDLPAMAVCADERTGDRSQLILFSSVKVDKEQANAILKAAGFSVLIKISRVVPVDAIPMMGTGKTDYRKLTTQLEK